MSMPNVTGPAPRWLCLCGTRSGVPDLTKIGETHHTKAILEQIEAEGLGASNRFADLLHVAQMKVYKVAERLDALDLLRRWLLTQIDLALDAACPQFGVLAQDECLAEVTTLRRTCTRYFPEGSFVKAAIVYTLCAVSCRSASYLRREITYKRRTCTRHNGLKIREKCQKINHIGSPLRR
jgi:hypothetical protein